MVDLSDLGVEYEQLLEVFRIRKICEDIASWMINEKCSLRMCAKELGYSKSTIHKYIHTYIKEFYEEEYAQIVTILRWNRKYRFRPRSRWYGAPW